MTAIAPYSPAPGVPLLRWATDSADTLRATLTTKGFVWLRGFDATRPDLAQHLLTALGADLMDDVFFSTPRSAVADKTYTATEYPPSERIPLHSEMAYLTTFPRLLAFHALVCPHEGGDTTVADLDAVSDDLGPIATQFLIRGVRYTRIFHPGLDIPLTTAFGTADLDKVAAIAAQWGMVLEMAGTGPARLTYTAQGALRDCSTGDPVWFNQAALHHPARLPASTRAALTDLYGAAGLPRQATFADGAPIPDETITAITAVLDRHTQHITWQPGDVVVVDNLRFLHGRAPYAGARTVHVAMGMPCTGERRQPLFEASAAAS